MMRKLMRFAIVTSATIFAGNSLAYEVDTHATIARRAYERSVLPSAELQERLGWNRYKNTRPYSAPAALQAFDDTVDAYWDVPASTWTSPDWPNNRRRKPQIYERNQFPAEYRFIADPNGEKELELLAWLMRGAVREDDLLTSSFTDDDDPPPDADPYGELIRVFHHFYDPVHDRPLSPVGLNCETLPLPGAPMDGRCRAATEWALGAAGVANNATAAPDGARRNHFTWADAREAMWCALTYRGSPISRSYDAAVRRLCWATQVKALGHALHLLQDMAQPQHTRNDRHNPPEEDVWVHITSTDMARRTYEVFTNWRVTGGEISSPDFEFADFRSMFEGFRGGRDMDRLQPRYDGYPTPRFTQAVDYYTTRRSGETVAQRRGLGDFSNRNVFSEGTQFSTAYPLPPANPTDAAFDILTTPPRLLADLGVIAERVYRIAPVETAAPGFIDTALAASNGRLPVAIEGLWEAATATVSSTQSIPLELYQTQADVLLPRAVAYSAGLIDFFYRGRLELSQPERGPYAALDHGTPHFVDVQGYPRRQSDNTVFGFTRLNVRVANATPAITPSGGGASVRQVAAGGKLVAVARYHRNPCYQTNLDGEWTRVFPGDIAQVPRAGVCAGRDALRTGYEEISVSAPINVRTDIDQQAPYAANFDFSADPIPVNATDLRVQVVYRGVLGEEADGIAVGHLDLPEPFFVAFINNADHYNNMGQWQPTGPGLAYPRESLDLINMGLPYSATEAVLVVRTQGLLRPARFLRIAMLAPAPPYSMYIAMRFEGDAFEVGVFDRINAAPLRQADREELLPGEYQPMPFLRERGVSYHWVRGLHRREGERPAPPMYELPPIVPRTAEPNLAIIGNSLSRADKLVPAPVAENAPSADIEWDAGQTQR